MRILLIAPELDGVSWSLETELISGNHVIVPLVGDVTHERITRASSKQRFDVLHVASHGSNEGVRISDGVLTREELAQIAKQVNVECIFLNACDSAMLGQFCVDRGVPLVISHTVAVMDSAALRTAAYFYDALTEHHGDLRKAYERCSPKDGTLAIFAGAGYLDRLIAPLLQMIQQLSEQLTALKLHVAKGQKSMISIIAGALVLMALFNAFSVWAFAMAPNAAAMRGIEYVVPQAVPIALTGTSEEPTPQEVGTETPLPHPGTLPEPPSATPPEASPATSTAMVATATDAATTSPSDTATLMPVDTAPPAQPTPLPSATDTAPSPVPVDTGTPTPDCNP